MSEAVRNQESYYARARALARRLLRHESAVLAGILAVLIVVLSVFTRGRFLAAANVRSILTQASILGLVSIGQMFVILTAGIDLSVGGIATLCSVIGSGLITNDPRVLLFVNSPIPWGVMVPIILLIALSIGAVNGLSVSRLGMPAIIVTLAIWLITPAVSYQLTQGFQVFQLPRSMAFFGQGSVGGVPVPIFIFVGAAVIAYLVLHYTTFGRSIYAIGGSPASAWLSGINTKKILLSVYLISGFLAGLAGFVILSRTMVGSIVGGKGLELNSIAAVCIGGTSLFGGRGTLIGSILGTVIITVIGSGMNAVKIDPSAQDIVRGAIIFAAVAADTLRRRR